MKTQILPPFAPTLIESTRAIGYSFEAAIADIIDNSIAADANKIDIYFFPSDDSYISIVDNGMGMSEVELEKAMQYGSKSPADIREAKDLGRFGLGLKTASLSQCRALTVVTKRGNSLYGRRWDIDHVISKSDWSLLVLEDEEIAGVPKINELKKNASGTLVVWQRLDRLSAGDVQFEKNMASRFDNVREHLALVFHRYLSGDEGVNKIQININNKPILPTDPFLDKRSNRPMADEVILISRGGITSRIIVRPYILPHISCMTAEEIKELGGEDGLKKMQGFYVYRNKRLITWGTWFRMMRQGDLSKLARIRVDIPNSLDDLWTLDIKKSSAIPPAEVRMNLEAIIGKIAEKSKRTWTYRGKKETRDDAVHIWNRMRNRQGGIYYEINREHPMVKHLVQRDSSLQIALFSLLTQIELGLPLNQLYVDLNNDEKIGNDKEQPSNEIEKTLRAIMSDCRGGLRFWMQ